MYQPPERRLFAQLAWLRELGLDDVGCYSGVQGRTWVTFSMVSSANWTFPSA